MEAGQEPAYGPRGETGQYEQREYLGQDAAESGYECDAGLRIEQGHGERNYDRYRQVDYYGVHDHLCHVTSQLAGDHSACGGCGTYHTEHGSLKEYAVTQYPGGKCGLAVHGPDHCQREQQERTYLDEQVPYIPAGGVQLTGFYTAEAYEQHEEQQYGLCLAAYQLQYGTGRVDGGYLHVYEVCAGTRYHAYHKHPVLKEFQYSASFNPLFHVCSPCFCAKIVMNLAENTIFVGFPFYISAPQKPCII